MTFTDHTGLQPSVQIDTAVYQDPGGAAPSATVQISGHLYPLPGGGSQLDLTVSGQNHLPTYNYIDLKFLVIDSGDTFTLDPQAQSRKDPNGIFSSKTWDECEKSSSYLGKGKGNLYLPPNANNKEEPKTIPIKLNRTAYGYVEVRIVLTTKPQPYVPHPRLRINYQKNTKEGRMMVRPASSAW